MDKVYAGLRWLKLNHFWVLSVMAAVFAAVAWYMSTNQLSQAYEAEHTKIKTKERGVKTIIQEENHFNDVVDDAMEKEIQKRRDNVKAAWETKWKQYENLLVWPDALTAKFHRAIKRLPRAEEISPADRAEPLHQERREEYRDYIKTELSKLAEIVGSKWTANDDSSSKRPGGNIGNPMSMRLTGSPRLSGDDETQLVYWSNENQSRIEEQSFDWSKQEPPIPTTLQVLYAQEDLWVLQALLNIIADANKNSTTNSSAVVKQILSLEWGRDARELLGEVTLVGTQGQKNGGRSSGEEFSLGGAGAAGRGLTSPGAGPGRGRFGPGMGSGEVVDPAEERYVNEKFKPMTASELRSVATGKNASNLTLAVAKRMPVRMRLSVDQKRLHDLLIACGNSSLVVEVRQLRFEPDAVQGRISGGGSRSFSGFSAPAMAMGTFGGNRNNTGENYYKMIELYGIIYIFYPVDEKLLGQESLASGPPNNDGA